MRAKGLPGWLAVSFFPFRERPYSKNLFLMIGPYFKLEHTVVKNRTVEPATAGLREHWPDYRETVKQES